MPCQRKCRVILGAHEPQFQLFDKGKFKMVTFTDKEPSKPLVLILIPMLNEEYGIGACIKSVLDQDYENWQIFCQDNNSSDKSFSIVSKLARMDSRINVKKLEEEVTASESLNLVAFNGMQTFDSNYVCWLGADDKWGDVNYLSSQIELLKNSKVNAVVPTFQLITPSTQNVGRAFNLKLNSTSKLVRVLQLLQSWNSVNSIYGLYSRSKFEDTFFNGGAVSSYNGSDWWWVYKAILDGPILNCSLVTYKKTIWDFDRRTNLDLDKTKAEVMTRIRHTFTNIFKSWKADVSPFYRHIIRERFRVKWLRDWTLILVVFHFGVRTLLNIPFSPLLLVLRKIKIWFKSSR